MLLENTNKIGGRGGRGFDRERGGEGEATTPSRDGAPVFKIYKVRIFHCLVLLLAVRDSSIGDIVSPSVINSDF